jgi:ABC-type multidrug transport system fused ATPase/permease subunit
VEGRCHGVVGGPHQRRLQNHAVREAEATDDDTPATFHKRSKPASAARTLISTLTALVFAVAEVLSVATAIAVIVAVIVVVASPAIAPMALIAAVSSSTVPSITAAASIFSTHVVVVAAVLAFVRVAVAAAITDPRTERPMHAVDTSDAPVAAPAPTNRDTTAATTAIAATTTITTDIALEFIVKVATLLCQLGVARAQRVGRHSWRKWCWRRRRAPRRAVVGV